jgi:RNA polymerase sigma factor for flagellar operon FliA
MAAPYTIDAAERERLILEYLPKVRWVAAGIHERLPPSISEEDLVSAGIVGLIAAIDKYDAGRSASLWTYAEYKIRGAILDSIRGLDCMSQHRRKRARELQAGIAAAEQRCQRTPEEQEIAQELGVTVDEYRAWLLETQGVTLGSLDVCGADGGEALVERYIADESVESPLDTAARAEMEGLLAVAIEHLPEPEQLVLHLYFNEELTLVEVGRVMSLHYSRVSQLKSQAVLRLRNYLQTRLQPQR